MKALKIITIKPLKTNQMAKQEKELEKLVSDKKLENMSLKLNSEKIKVLHQIADNDNRNHIEHPIYRVLEQRKYASVDFLKSGNENALELINQCNSYIKDYFGIIDLNIKN
jgi:hypothetical protein